jgi:hypothetical protein
LKMDLAKITRRESLLNISSHVDENHKDVWAAH